MANQIVSNIAFGAALAALVVGLWQDWGTFATLKRMTISYLAFFLLASALVLVLRLGGGRGRDADGAAGKRRAE